MTGIQHVFVGGVKVATMGRATLAEMIVRDCLERRAEARRPARLLFDSNGHAISLAASNPEFRAALEEADVVHADGGFVVLASRFLAGAPVVDRSATTDLIGDVVALGLGHGLKHYLLGASEEVNAACVQRLRELYPGIAIAGRRNGYFDNEAEVVRDIQEASPDVLWVGLGKPFEQMFAVRNKQRLAAKWVITCGGCFNYVTGDYRRAPRWMQAIHLEWLFRATTSPQLAWRYATTSPHAIWRSVTNIDRRRVGG